MIALRPQFVPAVCLALAGLAPSLRGEDLRKSIGFDQKLDAELPLDATFRDETGREVPLATFFRGKPVILTPVYYRCPMLCGLELTGLVRCLRAMDLTAGSEFEIVTFSIDPRETTDLAAKKKANILAQYGRDAAKEGWHFLTGDEDSIRRVCETIGFRAQFDPDTGQYGHAAGIVLCTPQGRVARYFFGVEFSPRDLQLSLVETSESRIGSLADHVLLYCYTYDPTQGKYGLAILNLLRGSGVLTVLAIVSAVAVMLRREQRAKGETQRHRGNREADGRTPRPLIQ